MLLGLALAALCLLGTVLFLTSLHRRSLLARAHRVVVADEFFETSGQDKKYWWLSDHELLLADRFDEDSIHGPFEPFLRKQDIAGIKLIITGRTLSHERWLFRKRDFTQGTTVNLAALGQVVNRADDLRPDIYISPNRQWLICRGGTVVRGHVRHGYYFYYVYHTPDCFAARLDGSHLLSWHDAFDDLVWSTDNDYWVELHSDWRQHCYDTAIIRSLTAPAQARQIRLAAHSPLNLQWMDIEGSIGLNEQSIEQKGIFLPPDRLLVRDDTGTTTPTHTFLITEYSLNRGGLPAHKYIVHLPPQSFFMNDAQWSPSGNHVALQLTYDATSPLLHFLHRFLPIFRLPPRWVDSLWVSSLNGSDMKEVGYLPIHNPHGNGLSNLQWLPDGKYLSFVYDHALWTVPVD